MLLVDASAWIALFNPKDNYHWLARSFWTRLARQRTRLLTSYYVLDEAYTLLRRQASLKEVVAFHKTVGSSSVLTIADIDRDLRERAWRLMLTYSDKVVSYTDCTSFALMRQRDIYEAFSFDGDFVRAGFVRLPIAPE